MNESFLILSISLVLAIGQKYINQSDNLLLLIFLFTAFALLAVETTTSVLMVYITIVTIVTYLLTWC